MKYSLGISNFLKRSLVFLILLFSSISLHWSPRKAFLSLLAILLNSSFRRVYLSFSPLIVASLLITAICKASSDSHFASLHFFSMEIVLIHVSYTMSRTSIHSSAGTLSIRSSPLNFQMFKLVLEKAEESEIKLPTSTQSLKKQESSRKTSISALLTIPKPLIVWITINCGKFWKRWEYQTIWPASWETYMQVRKQRLELDMEQQIGSK